VVKKTVAIHPVIDSFIRKVWATLIEHGYNATYSTSLNLLLLYAILKILNFKDEDCVKILRGFINDENVLTEINLEDQMTNVIDILAKKLTLYTTKKGAENYLGKA